jgi:hypothetical protein
MDLYKIKIFWSFPFCSKRTRTTREIFLRSKRRDTDRLPSPITLSKIENNNGRDSKALRAMIRKTSHG